MIKVFRGLNKVVSILVLLTMIISIIPAFANDIDVPILTVSSQSVYRGGTSQVRVTLDKPETISGLQFFLNYDKSKFEITDQSEIVINPDLAALNIDLTLDKEKGIIRLVGAKIENTNIKTPVDVITVKMIAKTDAAYGKSDITLSDYYLDRVNSSTSDVTQIIPQIMNGSITVQSSGGGSSGSRSTPTPTPTATPTAVPTATPTITTPPAVVNVEVKPVVVDNKATSTVTEAAATKAITEAIATAKKDNTTSEVKINVEPTTEAVTTVETAIKETTMTQLKNSAVDNVTIATSTVDVTFDKKAINVISENTKNDVSLSVTKVDNATLSDDVQKVVGDKPVYNFNLVSNGNKISDFKDGSAKITIPYGLKAGELAKDIIVYYIKDDGTLTKMTNVKYDEKLKAAVFYTNHFSKFTIAFEKIKFTDVSGWSEEFIYFLAEKGIINGKAEGIFAPEDNITRAEFVAIIARSVGISNDQTFKAEYPDVTKDDWFAPYVTWAKEKGIVSGYEDGTFGPDKQITREELCTMIVRALTAYSMAPAKATLNFADSDITSDWAKESVASLANLGVVNGKGDNKFAPLDNATRAESAKIISAMYKILNASK